MDKYEQIGKLAEAYALIQEVINVRDVENEDHVDELQDVADIIANISDDIEGFEAD